MNRKRATGCRKHEIPALFFFFRTIVTDGHIALLMCCVSLPLFGHADDLFVSSFLPLPCNPVVPIIILLQFTRAEMVHRVAIVPQGKTTVQEPKEKLTRAPVALLDASQRATSSTSCALQHQSSENASGLSFLTLPHPRTGPAALCE